MGHTLLFTGQPGAGKTTLVKKLAQSLGSQAGGFYTQELRGQGGRQGFELVTLAGKQALLAHTKIRGPHRVGRYGVDIAAIDRVGVAAIRQALDQRQIVVIDEIGKMELFSSAFQGIVLKAMSSPCLVVATVMSRPHAWINALKAMPQVVLWQVTSANREALLTQAIGWLDAHR